MRFPRALFLFFLAAAFAGPVRCLPQSDKLASVRVTGSMRYSSDQIVAALGLHTGSPVTKEDLQKAADKLVQMGPFLDVQYRFGSGDAGVDVQYQVKDAPGMAAVFDNFPWFTDDELKDAIKKSVPLFDGTAPEHGTLLDAISGALEMAASSKGVFSKVSHRIGRDPANDVPAQVFHLEDSELAVVKFEFSDAVAQSDRGIQSRLADLVGKPFSRTAIQVFEFEQVRPVYLAKGYLRVHFGSPQAKIGGANGAAAKSVTVAAPIEPGAQYVWNGVIWDGNMVFSRADLDKYLDVKTGDPADGNKIEASWQHVRDAYSARGYLDADLQIHAAFDEPARRIFYGVTISEGPQYRMGKLTLSGLSAEGERRIRGVWKMQPGATFDEAAYESFLDSGVKQAFAGLPFHYEMIGRFLDKNPATGVVDVLLDFQ
jgi:outer membrane protein assembly factor BamA